MKKKLNSGFAGLLISLLIIIPSAAKGQSEKALVKKYLSVLPKVERSKTLQKYRMTAVYINRDLYGNFTGKTKVSGDYTRGLPGDSSMWNNVYISASNNFSDPFPSGTKQEYMENFRYIPSDKMMEEEAFKSFPKSVENIFARNLIWDMMSADIFAWNYYDSLKLNVPYIIPDIKGEFNMADIGIYSHNKIVICWKGISEINGQLCALIEFSAIDNKLELSMDMIKTKGTEQYWGSVLVSIKTKNIEHADMYSGTIQEIEVKGMKDKFLMKTIRELEIKRIQ
ncbi:MAG: hypothetical protein ABR927_04825 [Bacteroidales bacterium]|jgi:hypothetical protein